MDGGENMEPSIEKYVSSKFNILYTKDNDTYVWNTYSGSLLKLSEKGYNYLTSFPREKEDSEYFRILEQEGIVLNENIDEIGKIIYDERKALFSANGKKLSVVIALGMACNYRCTYCFQGSTDYKSLISSVSIEKIAEYICDILSQSSEVKELNIRWFGGEPLLYLKNLILISGIILKYTEKNKIKYTSGIITNGRYLTKENVEILKKYNVISAQVTIDGMEKTYCKSKNATPEDFKCVIDNIENSKDILRISIRLNIPHNASEEAIRITDYLLKEKKLLGKVGVYFAFVRDFDKDDEQESYANYVEEYMKWLKHVIENYGFRLVDGVFPKRKITSCGYIRSNNLCIDYNGKLYKCEHCFGNPDMIIGDIFQGDYYNSTEFKYWTTIDKRKKCLDCTYLPICMGGCANDFVSKQLGQDCESYKKMQLVLKLIQGGVYNKDMKNKKEKEML